jgi:hypothetical protein
MLQRRERPCVLWYHYHNTEEQRRAKEECSDALLFFAAVPKNTPTRCCVARHTLSVSPCLSVSVSPCVSLLRHFPLCRQFSFFFFFALASSASAKKSQTRARVCVVFAIPPPSCLSVCLSIFGERKGIRNFWEMKKYTHGDNAVVCVCVCVVALQQKRLLGKTSVVAPLSRERERSYTGSYCSLLFLLL